MGIKREHHNEDATERERRWAGALARGVRASLVINLQREGGRELVRGRARIIKWALWSVSHISGLIHSAVCECARASAAAVKVNLSAVSLFLLLRAFVHTLAKSQRRKTDTNIQIRGRQAINKQTSASCGRTLANEHDEKQNRNLTLLTGLADDERTTPSISCLLAVVWHVPLPTDKARRAGQNDATDPLREPEGGQS